MASRPIFRLSIFIFLFLAFMSWGIFFVIPYTFYKYTDDYQKELMEICLRNEDRESCEMYEGNNRFGFSEFQ